MPLCLRGAGKKSQKLPTKWAKAHGAAAPCHSNRPRPLPCALCPPAACLLTAPPPPLLAGIAFEDLGWRKVHPNGTVENATPLTSGAVTYTLSYNRNGAPTGTVPASHSGAVGTPVTISGSNGLEWDGHSFGGWNTAADGSGTAYAAGAASSIPQNGAVLYAQWVPFWPAPVANNDAFVCEWAALCRPPVRVVANDSSPNSGAVLNATLATPPANGTLTLASNGTLTYLPAP